MPAIARFRGLVITMYHDDHRLPHFHARYGGESVSVSLEPLQVLAGELPSAQLRQVMEWAVEHAEELAAKWALVAADQPPGQIDGP